VTILSSVKRPHKQRFRHWAIKPSEESKETKTEIDEELEDVELPEYVPDPLLNADPDDENVDITQMDPKRRMTKIIVELVNAGGYFEDKLEEYRDYLDAELLEKFYRRIETAEKHEDENAAEGLRLIWRRVRAEVERKNASPSMRLLDKLLALLHPSVGGTPKDRYRSALGLMYEAFTQSQSDTVDIFDLAASLADGAEPPSKLLQEFVQKSEFINEMEQILEEAEAADQELAEKKESLILQRMDEDDQGKQYMILSKQLESLDRFMDERQQSLKDVKMLLEMARGI